MKILKYVPSVIFALIEIIIVVIVLDNSSYSSNSEIMAGLVLLYASIRTIGIGIGTSISNLTLAFAKDMTDIKERIRADFDTEEAKEKLKEGKEIVDKSNVKSIIRGVGVFIIYLIALFSLLG